MAESGFSQTSKMEQDFYEPAGSSWPWWPLVIVLVAVIAIGGLLWAAVLWQVRIEEENSQRAVGARLTELALEPLTGDPPPVTLADLQGKVTLINFWGPWCKPCIQEFPHLVEILEHYGKRDDFRFISVASNQDPLDLEGLAEETALFLKQHQVNFPTYSDPAAKTRQALIDTAGIEAFGYPATLVVGRDGRLRGLWLGYVPGEERHVREAIEMALRGDAPKGPTSQQK